MDKAYILNEIKRTANENRGMPLGKQRFFAEKGIKESDWLGIHWTRWSAAIREAGFTPNELTTAYDKEELLKQYANLVLELGRMPVSADVRMKRRRDPAFPSHNVFANRLGSKAQLLRELTAYCREHVEYEPVLRLCEPEVLEGQPEQSTGLHRHNAPPNDIQIGFVYLIKSGRFYKIGHSNAAGRREYELALQLPEKITTIHVIRTDDPPGIEAYWHHRFKDKRKRGEWFDLSGADVSAFKRRKFM